MKIETFKGEKLGILEMRGHAPWYLKGIPNASEVRKNLTKSNTKEEMKAVLKEFLV